uniref:CCHC-type domain-containing protein n=1 Tax=Glossina austeni TaxID=7395 RepID=A0A1A9V133_GLOAU
MGGTLSQFATVRSEVAALKETAAKQQLGVGDRSCTVQALIIDDANNVLCEECPTRQHKNKRPKATVRKCYNCDRVGHITRKCKFRRKDSHLRQKHVEKTVTTPECREDREGRTKEENAKENIVVRGINVETNVKFSKDDVQNAQLADDDLKVIIISKKAERVNCEQIDKASPIAKSYWAQWESLVFEDGYLWRIWYSKNDHRTRKLLVIPRAKCKEIIEKHRRGRNGEHFGVMKTVKEIKRGFYWLGSRKSVAWIRSYEESNSKEVRNKLKGQGRPKRSTDRNS